MLSLRFLALGLLLCTAAYAQLQFRVIKEWQYANYTWRSEEDLSKAISSGAYNPESCVMSGLAYFDGFYYIATPRMFPGTPATLSRVPERGPTAPLLEPFPSWKKNGISDCQALQNVQNIAIDADGNLYVIDSGRSHTMVRSENYCPAKIIKYDLKTRDGDELAKEIYRYEFPENVAPRKVNFLYDLVLDDQYVYISDNSAQDPGLIVFSEADMQSWKIRHGTFRADENATTLNVSGTVLQRKLNLAGLALGPNIENTGRLLYYAPLSSYSFFAVSTKDLKNPATTTLKEVHLVGRKSSQSDGMTVDDKGVLYFGQLGSSSIAKWDTTKPGFHPRLIAQDPAYVQWPNSLTFNAAGDLVVLCNTLAKFITHRVDLNEANFRLLAGNVGAQSYVRNRLKYDENTSHVHFHPVTPNATHILGNESIMGTADVNDLLIHDVADHHNHSLSGASLYNMNYLCMLFACTWLLLGKRCGFHN